MCAIFDVRYARSGDVSIAYQVVGDGPIDLVFVPFESLHGSVARSSTLRATGSSRPSTGRPRGIRCAQAIIADVGELGLDLRAGLHTGECELHDGKPAGIAVSVGSCVAGEASPGQVVVSRTVRDLVAGSEIEFEDIGDRMLKGVPGE